MPIVALPFGPVVAHRAPWCLLCAGTDTGVLIRLLAHLVNTSPYRTIVALCPGAGEGVDQDGGRYDVRVMVSGSGPSLSGGWESFRQRRCAHLLHSPILPWPPRTVERHTARKPVADQQ